MFAWKTYNFKEKNWSQWCGSAEQHFSSVHTQIIANLCVHQVVVVDKSYLVSKTSFFLQYFQYPVPLANAVICHFIVWLSGNFFVCISTNDDENNCASLGTLKKMSSFSRFHWNRVFWNVLHIFIYILITVYDYTNFQLSKLLCMLKEKKQHLWNAIENICTQIRQTAASVNHKKFKVKRRTSIDVKNG